VGNLTRRALLKARFSTVRPAIRLPWVLNEEQFTNGCTRCYDCMEACPEKIIIKGDGGFPEINFNKGECTFCVECVKSCPEDLFYPIEEVPWSLKAQVTEECFTNKKVVCVVCKEQCEVEALTFIPKVGGVMSIELSLELCSGCGACAKPCPANAIEFNYINEFEH